MSASVLGAVAGLVASLSTAACDPTEACTAGTEGCACMENSCLGDLVCRSGACVDILSSGDDDDDAADGNDDDDDDNGDGGPVDACGQGGGLTVTGSLKTNVANIVFDRVSAEIRHKRDIDEFEDGCVNFIRFVLGSGDGCELAVEAHSLFTPQGRLEIQGLRFTADSQCPDFPDIAEGVYQIGANGLVTDGSGIAGELEVPDRNAAESCVSGDYHLFLAGTLDGGIDNLLVKPTELVISGAFDSYAHDQACPSF